MHSKKDKHTLLEDVLNGSAFTKVCAILRSNDYSYTHESGYGYFNSKDIEKITYSLMQESPEERDFAQDCINLYNALMQYSNYIANSAANCDKEMEKLATMIDVYEMQKQIGEYMKNMTENGYLKIDKPLEIPFKFHFCGTGGFTKINTDGTYTIDIEKKGDLLVFMHIQSAQAERALGVLKAWIEVGKNVIGNYYESPMMQLVPFNFLDYLEPHDNKEYSKYYKYNDITTDKLAVFPQYDLTPKDIEGEKTANSILNTTLRQWELNKTKIAAIKKRLKKA